MENDNVLKSGKNIRESKCRCSHNDVNNDDGTEQICCSNRTKMRTEEEKHAINTRLNRLIGQLNGIKNMIEQDRYCDDVLIQLSAADKSIKALANMILEAHMHTCLIENIQAGNLEVVDEIVDLFKRFQ